MVKGERASDRCAASQSVGVGQAAVRVTRLQIPDVLLIEKERYPDERGWFSGIRFEVVQENRSWSSRMNTLRGLSLSTSTESPGEAH